MKDLAIDGKLTNAKSIKDKYLLMHGILTIIYNSRTGQINYLGDAYAQPQSKSCQIDATSLFQIESSYDYELRCRLLKFMSDFDKL